MTANRARKMVPEPLSDFVAGLVTKGVLTQAFNEPLHAGGVGAPFRSLVVGVAVISIGEYNLI